jgi:hypothetical protein
MAAFDSERTLTLGPPIAMVVATRSSQLQRSNKKRTSPLLELPCIVDSYPE